MRCSAVHACLVASLAAAALPAVAGKQPPHILLIVSDDLGWNDVSFHGSKQIGTPNIDALTTDGVQLYNWHAQPVCSPTRSTLMSGRHVIHTGLYMPFSQGTNLRLALNYTLLPGYLKKLGYSTHMVGKWHLGQNVLAALPTGRGFDSYFGYWSGAEEYYSHEVKHGYDFSEDTAATAEEPANCTAAFEYNGTYSANAFTQKAVDVINGMKSKKDTPMFLYLAYQNVHWPLEVPQEYLDMYSHVPDSRRQHICAMAKIMDDGIGNVTGALKKQGIYDDTIIWFSSDNGGPTNGNEGTWSDNFPLRGGKNTIWEGGTRLASVVRFAGMANPGSISFAKIHATDLLPTLLTAAAGGADWHKLISDDEPAYLLGDGMSAWGVLSKGEPSSRTEFILECHPEGAPHSDMVHGNAFIMGDMKIIKVVMQNNEPGWYVPPGEDFNTTHYTLQKFGCGTPPTFDPKEMTWAPCNETFCLFNVTADPCEYHNLADKHPEIVDKLTKRLKDYQATAVPPVRGQGCQPVIDKAGAWRPCDDPNLALALALAADELAGAPADEQQGGDGWAMSGTDEHGTRVEY